MPFIRGLRRQRQVNLYEFKTSVVYVAAQSLRASQLTEQFREAA